NQYEHAGHGGTERVKEVGYAETELAQLCHEGRLRLMGNGKIAYQENIAAIKYRNPYTNKYETMWAKSAGDEHAERILEDALKQRLGPQYSPELIEILYTERIPCGPENKDCYGWMKAQLRNAKIEYTFFTRPRPGGGMPIKATDELTSFYMNSYDAYGR